MQRRTKKTEDPLARDHEVRRQHERHEKDEDGARYRGDDGATEPNHVHRISLYVGDRLRDGVRHEL
ncbi:MAG: hypothetical protein QOE33_3652, partial [Acidobacteriota bacterium]|nr:hypothetical protein [Acidobacteriota bacterium]